MSEVRDEEERLGLKLPPSLRAFVAFVHDAGQAIRDGAVFRGEAYTPARIGEPPAVSLMEFATGRDRESVREEDLCRDDPPVHRYRPERSGGSYSPLLGRGIPIANTVSEWVFGRMMLDIDHENAFGVSLSCIEGRSCMARLAALLPVCTRYAQISLHADDGMVARLFAMQEDAPWSLDVRVSGAAAKSRLPSFLLDLVPSAGRRSGCFKLSPADDISF